MGYEPYTNAKKSFFMIEKIKKYRKCPALPAGTDGLKGTD